MHHMHKSNITPPSPLSPPHPHTGSESFLSWLLAHDADTCSAAVAMATSALSWRDASHSPYVGVISVWVCVCLCKGVLLDMLGVSCVCVCTCVHLLVIMTTHYNTLLVNIEFP